MPYRVYVYNMLKDDVGLMMMGGATFHTTAL
jgi:hypothetical protein